MDETIRHRIRWVSYLLIAVSVLLIMKGSVEFFLPRRGQDFWYRWSAQQYVFAGIDPFRIAFWTIEHKGGLPPDVPREIAARAGDPVNVVDPPWVFAYGVLIDWPPRHLAPVWFMVLNSAALLSLVAVVHRLNGDLEPTCRLFCTAAFFANLGFSHQLVNGNYGIIALAGAAGCFLALRSNSSVLAGAGFALAQIKMTIGSPLAIPLLVRRKVMAISTAAVILVFCSFWTSKAVAISIPGLVTRMLEGADRFSTGGHSLYQVLTVLAVPKKTALILCASLVFSLGVWMARRWKDDDFAQMAIFAVCARTFTYHNVIDDVVIAFVVLFAARTWIQSGLDTRLGCLVAVLIGSVLIPARIGGSLGAQVTLQLVWCSSLILALATRIDWTGNLLEKTGISSPHPNGSHNR